MDKRGFLKKASALGVGATLTFPILEKALAGVDEQSSANLARNEEFWALIRAGYRIKPDYINLENGYYCIQPEETLSAFIEHVREVNYQGSWYMRTVQEQNKKEVASELAEMAGCGADELVITRNTTESLDLVIGGLDWKAGDEAVMAKQDYGAMLNHFDLMADRYGIVNRRIMLPNHPEHDQEIVDTYAAAINEKTRLLMVCHMVNITGQILPIRKICDMAHERGVEVMVDGAHAFAHIDFRIDELNCDYYGTSLHKWLSVPLGAGFLYVKSGNASKLWPLFAEDKRDPNDISRLNHTGTHPVHTDLAILNAIAYHNKMGIKRKEERLRYLQHYWTSKVRSVKGITVNTPREQFRHAAIGNVGVDRLSPAELSRIMLEEYGIWTVAIDRPGVRGLRITPNVFTTTEELEALVGALKKIAG